MSQLYPWCWRSLPLEGRSGSEIFAALFAAAAIATLLESPASQSPSRLSRYSLCAGPPRRPNGRLQLWTPPLGQILPHLHHLLPQAPLEIPGPDLPFTGGWLGWLGYDLAWEIEQLPWLRQDQLPFPVAYWYEPECFAVLDHQQQLLWLAASQPAQLDQLQQRLHRPVLVPDSPGPLALTPVFALSQADYVTRVLKAQEYIRAGEIFQANLSLRFAAQGPVDSWQLYRALQQINPSPFASYWRTPWGAVVSCSPERLVQLQGRQAETRPIAGTRSRGHTPAQDQLQAQDLLRNAKENAEHTMLVDLERNDLGRVCAWGSVRVNEFRVIESYSHVMHLVSNVVGTLRPGVDPVALIRAMFPGGTITGCPKVRCMEIIEALEPVRRNLFYGSCGYLDQRGNLDLNILIRTLLVAPLSPRAANSPPVSTIWGQVGAGIVADSDPEREWQESLQKAQAQLAALRQLTSEQSSPAEP